MRGNQGIDVTNNKGQNRTRVASAHHQNRNHELRMIYGSNKQLIEKSGANHNLSNTLSLNRLNSATTAADTSDGNKSQVRPVPVLSDVTSYHANVNLPT